MKDLMDFFVKTKLGRVLGGIALATVTGGFISILIILSGNNKAVVETAGNASETEILLVQSETSTEKETEVQITTQPETETTKDEAFEEETTSIEVIAVEDLNVSDRDLSNENEVLGKNQNMEDDEPQEEPTTSKPSDNKVPSAPPAAVNEYACLVHGIDVSKWQGDIDWAKVKAAGYNFAIIKCAGRSTDSAGELYVDSKFEQNIQGALANGMQVGVYFFSQALTVREAQEEASLVINLLKPYKITYPVVFDWEDGAGFRNENANLSNSAMTDIVKTYLTMVEQAGYEGMVYGNKTDLFKFDYMSIAEKYKIWYARWFAEYQDTDAYYVAGEEIPSLPCAFQMWQYKSTGRVPGINTNVDMDVAFFSYTGSGVPSKPLQIEMENKELVINEGSSIDVMSGVKATSTAGTDISANVTFVVKDSEDIEVSLEEVINTPGEYTITYYIKDFTGVSKSETATLSVRSKPVITLQYDCLNYFINTDNEGVTKEAFTNAVCEKIRAALENNIISAVDNENNDISENVILKEAEGFFTESLTAGAYIFEYSVTDGKGLAGSATLVVNMVDLKETSVECTLEKLSEKLYSNITTENTFGIKLVYSSELLQAIETNGIISGTEYEIKYVVEGFEEELFYKKCIVKIIINESAGETNGDATGETE